VSLERAADAFREALLEDDPELLYDQAPCGYLSTTPDGRIVKVNATFCTWLGQPPERLLGRRLADLLTPGGRIYHETHVAPMLEMQGFAREIALDVQRADGTRLPVLLNATLQRSGDGTPRVVRVAVFDATERRAYERELVAAHDAALAAKTRAAALAHTLQQNLLPPIPPRVPGLEIATAYRSASDGTDVGGDFYDVFPSGRRDWSLVLGDVSGKGAEAAVVTSVVRSAVRALTVLGHPLPEVLQGVNEVLRQRAGDKFCTLVLGGLRRDGDSDGWAVSLVAAGHPPPLLMRRGAEPTYVDIGGPLVGVLPAVAYEQLELLLTGDDTLLFYTDGVTEARQDDECFGEERLLEWARPQQTLEPTELIDSLLEELAGYQGARGRDDIAIVAIHPAGHAAG
jgi:sigma-B regulation protein RsbU (phosphoserine phosphatase)